MSELRDVAKKAEDLAPLLPNAEATVNVITPFTDEEPCTVTDMTKKNILLLGSGRVANSFSEYLGRDDGRKVVVAGNVREEVSSVAGEAKFGEVRASGARAQASGARKERCCCYYPVPTNLSVCSRR
jgi:hypothetical protein